MSDLKNITVRANGKCHPAVELKNGSFMICCACPGSRNGKLANSATKVADGHDVVNCNKKS